ncbi:unnamed protein product, partial [Polarella glacialis]
GTDKEKWGFVWDAQAMKVKGIRLLEKVSSNSLASDWGRRYAGRDARKGDVLVKVNGVGESTDLMSLELKKNRVSCEFTPVQSRDSAAEHASRSASLEVVVSPTSKMKVELAPLKPSAAAPRGG